MSVHVHTLRSYCAGAMGVVLAVILLDWAYAPPAGEAERAEVTGRVTCGGRPAAGMYIVFMPTDPHGSAACSLIRDDGSFRMQPWSNYQHAGVPVGAYRVFFAGARAFGPDSPLDSRYQNTTTSDLRVEVGPAWNDFAFALPDRGGESPDLVHHQ